MSWNETYSNGSYYTLVSGGGTSLFSSLGLLGGNLTGTSDYQTSRFFQNAFLDGRGFNAPGTYTGGNQGITVDANGWPTVACWCVLTSQSSSTADGNLPVGTYHSSFQSIGQTTTIGLTGSSNVSITNIVNLGDSLTTTFDIVITGSPGGNTVILTFSGAVKNLIVARTGSPSSLSGVFNQDALDHFGKFNCLRTMDFLGTNNSTVTTWASRTPFVQSLPTSLEWAIDFGNSVYTNSSSKLKTMWLNMPPQADNSFATNAATLLSSRGNSSINYIVEVGNEPWNFAFTQYGTYQTNACAEIKAVANYSITSTISSVVRSSNVTTVTLTGTLPSYITNGVSGIIWCDDSTFAVGTVPSPVTITVTGSTTFTYPNTGSNITLGTSVHIAAIFGLTSTLITDNTSTSLYDMSYKWYTRRSYEFANAWHAVRPQDKFILNLQMYGSDSTTPANSQYLPLHLSYGSWLASGSINSWLYGAAIAPYVTSDSSTTATGVFASLTTSLNNTIVHNIRDHIYASKLYGLIPITYEGGPDTQASPTIQTTTHTDARMGTLVTSLLDLWYQNGGQLFNFYHITPAGFSNVAQGAWPSSQSYLDDSSSKHAALLSYQNGSTTIAYQNQWGNPGTALLTEYARSSSSGGVVSGVFGFYAPTTGSWIDVVITCPTTKVYSLTLWGSDSTSSSSISLIIDGVSIGNTTLPQNGSFSGSNTPAACTSINSSLSAGAHILRVQIASGYSSPALQKVIIV